MKKFLFPSVFVLLCLGVLAGCAGIAKFVHTGGSIGVAEVPPMDADGDGQVDQAYLTWASSIGGGIVPWLGPVLGFLGVAGAAYARWQDSKNHAASVATQQQIKQEVEVTDKNVTTVAEHAKVPEEKLL